MHPNGFDSLTGFLLDLGAQAVYPVDAGIPEFARLSAISIARRGPGLHILSACPMAIRFVRERFPSLAAAVLDVLSPMTLQATRGLHDTGIHEKGFALALTPCSYKRLEAPASGIDLRVVTLKALATCCSAASIDPFAAMRKPYSSPVPHNDEHCTIARTVALELKTLGIAAEIARMDGAHDAENWLEAFLAAEVACSSGRFIAAEITFCRGGCSKGS